MYIQMNSSSDFMTWKNLAKVSIVFFHTINHYKIYPRVMGFDALKHYFITYEVYMWRRVKLHCLCY